MKKNVMVINYLMYIGLILLVIVFLILLVSISRFVLSDYNPIGAHVMNTKNLLEDINEVEKVAISTQNVTLISETGEDFFRLNYDGFNIRDVSYININENKSIVSMYFTSEIADINDEIYYIKIKDIDNFEKGDIVLYNSIEEPRVGEFLSVDEQGKIIIVNQNTEKLEEASEEGILGRIFYIRR